MGFQRDPPISRSGWLDPAAMAARARRLIEKFGVRIANERALASSLSGGNLQKMVVARELSHGAPVLVAEQPTRGIDVGATEFIHGQLVAERDKGHAVLLVSAELSEILALSDRVLVMYEGRILADLPRTEASEEKLGLLMAGRSAVS
jgi:simple sugar transport system ATP-binding protein